MVQPLWMMAEWIDSRRGFLVWRFTRVQPFFVRLGHVLTEMLLPLPFVVVVQSLETGSL